MWEYQAQNKARLTVTENEALSDFDLAMQSTFHVVAAEIENLTGLVLPGYPVSDVRTPPT